MLTLDLSADFEAVADNLVAVTLSGDTDTPVSNALERAVSTREVEASAGKYTKGDVAWHLPASQVTTQPNLGDQIIDALGNVWTILEVAKQTFGSRWRCMTRNLAIAHKLNCFVKIQRAAMVKQGPGDVQPVWSDWLVQQLARIQPESSTAEVANDLRLNRQKYRIILAVEPPEELDQTHRIVDEDGQLYKITGYESPATITDLYVVTAQIVPFPQAS